MRSDLPMQGWLAEKISESFHFNVPKKTQSLFCFELILKTKLFNFELIRVFAKFFPIYNLELFWAHFYFYIDCFLPPQLLKKGVKTNKKIKNLWKEVNWTARQ